MERQGIGVETDPIAVFGDVLRSLRDRSGMSQKDLAGRVYCSASLVSAIELGNKPAKLDLVERMDAALDGGGALVAVWPITTAGTYPSWFTRVAELEREAFKIHEWELKTIPGLVQTPGYARAIMRAARPRDTDEEIERDVTARMERQEIFTADNPPMAWFVLDESVLRRPFGGPNVMRDQLAKLEKLSNDPNIVIQVMPFSATSHPGMEGPLRILEFMDSPPIWYTEGWFTGRIAETREEIASAMTSFDLIRASALSPDESIQVIGEIRRSEYGSPDLD